MTQTTDLVIDFCLELFLKERLKIREIYRQVPELGRLPALLETRRIVVDRIARVMKKHYPGKKDHEYNGVSFVAVNSVMGVVQIMLIDEQQTYSTTELAAEIKAMLNSYFAHLTA